MKRASSDVNLALQPRVAQAKRSLELSLQQIGLKPGKEIYTQDERLLDFLLELDAIRSMLSKVTSAVNNHRARLLDLARSENALASILSSPSDNLLTVLRKQLSPARVDAQLGLGAAQLGVANGNQRFALDMATPMADLGRTFEECYSGKIMPLLKRYYSQKGEWLRFVRQAEQAEEGGRKESLGEMARSAEPMWKATSDTLVAEIQSLLRYTTSHLSDWTLNVAQAQAETYARAAKVFEAPARDAEAAQNEQSL